MTGGNGPSCCGWVINVSIRPSPVGISTNRSFIATSSPCRSIRSLDAAFGLTADMRQHAGIIPRHDPTRQRQPVEDRLELELVRRPLDDVGAAVEPRDKLEARHLGI